MSGFENATVIPDKLRSSFGTGCSILRRHSGAARRAEPGTRNRCALSKGRIEANRFPTKRIGSGFRAQALRTCPGMTVSFPCEVEAKR